jgi:hypothetical protein
MRLLGTKLAANSSHRGFGDQLYDLSGQLPSLDLNFAANKSLIDSASGQNLVTFTRASSGTYVGSDGLIRTAVTNLLLRSEEFESASWTPGQTSVNANVIQSPNGSLTADKLIENSNTSTHLIQQIIAHTSGTTYTASCFVKVAERTFFSIAFGSGFIGAQANSFFDLSNGTTPTSGATVVNVGDGWFRCSFTVAATASASSAVQFRLATSTSVANYTGDNTSGIYLWGAQLEQSSSVGEYIPTTSTINSAPRFDHNPTTGESLGLLVEEQRTNLLLQSNGFDTTWINTLSSETAAAGIAPDGTNTAWELRDTLDASSNNHIITQPGIAFASGTAYTFSVFAKRGTLESVAVVFPSAMLGNATIGIKANITNGTIVASATGATNIITAYPNGWYRITTTMTATTSGTGAMQIRTALLIGGTGTTYQGDGTGTILIWGAQLEAGAFPTSYIPTTTATVTRSADVASITGANFSSWYRQDEGTVFSQAILPPGAFNTIVNINTTNNDTITSRTTATQANFNVVVSGTTQTGALNISYSPYTVLKSVGCYALNDFALSANGATPVTDATGTVPAVIQANIGRNAANTNYANGTIARLAYWPQRLSNSTLQAVTQ